MLKHRCKASKIVAWSFKTLQAYVGTSISYPQTSFSIWIRLESSKLSFVCLFNSFILNLPDEEGQKFESSTFCDENEARNIC